MKISACWITKNEEKNLAYSVESLGGVADELIVVDTGSTDGTIEIAKSFGARVEYFEWINDFSAARNFAMSLATGDIIIFLDADEWFEPKLTNNDRNFIINLFKNNSLVDMLAVFVTSYKGYGSPAETSVTTRIYLNKENLRFTGKIHEFVPMSPGRISLDVSDRFRIGHSGYSVEIVLGKAGRNLSIIKTALNEARSGSNERIKLLFYYIRESFLRGEHGDLLACVSEILLYPKVLKEVFSSMTESVFRGIIFIVLRLILSYRKNFSRRYVRQRLFDIYAGALPNSLHTPAIKLLYRIYFDHKEDLFLADIGSALENLSGAEQRSVFLQKEFESDLYKAAAAAENRRSGTIKAMEYAVSALKNVDKYNKDILYILLRIVKNQPPEDVVLLLSGIYDISKLEELELLIECTCFFGLNQVQAYYLKKRSELDDPPIDVLLRSFLIYGKYRELAVIATEAHEAGNKVAARYLFLAAICGAPRETIESYSHMLEEYSNILNAFCKKIKTNAITTKIIIKSIKTTSLLLFLITLYHLLVKSKY